MTKNTILKNQEYLPYKGIRPSELVIYFVSHCFDELKTHAEWNIRKSNWDRTKDYIKNRRSFENGNDNGTEE